MTSNAPALSGSIRRQRDRLIAAMVLTAATCAAALWIESAPEGWSNWRLPEEPMAMAQGVLVALLALGAMTCWCYLGVESRRRWTSANQWTAITRSIEGDSVEAIRQALLVATKEARDNPLVAEALLELEPRAKTRILSLVRLALVDRLSDETSRLKRQATRNVKEARARHPLIKAERALRDALEQLQHKKQQAQLKWDEIYKTLSWYQKFKCGDPDFKKVDGAIRQLKDNLWMLEHLHGSKISKVNAHFQTIETRLNSRITDIELPSRRYLEQCGNELTDVRQTLSIGLWCSLLSVPVSLWDDISSAGTVYGALRSAHSQLAGMSDTEVWWHALTLPNESLVGLASLAKGAFLEKLVATDTGGELHAHFNHPTTDIVIDGVPHQIKATDSVQYVDSVDPDIPVITTSEVAVLTGDIDSGYSDEDLSRSVELALGGTVIDAGDTAVDAVLSGLGGLGLMASIQGINHAVELHRQGEDPLDAALLGLEVAIDKTAGAVVGTMEVGYKLAMSGPSRFLGRLLLRAARLRGAKPQSGPDPAKR